MVATHGCVRYAYVSCALLCTVMQFEQRTPRQPAEKYCPKAPTDVLKIRVSYTENPQRNRLARSSSERGSTEPRSGDRRRRRAGEASAPLIRIGFGRFSPFGRLRCLSSHRELIRRTRSKRISSAGAALRLSGPPFLHVNRVLQIWANGLPTDQSLCEHPEQTYSCLQARNCCVNASSSARYSSPCSFV